MLPQNIIKSVHKRIDSITEPGNFEVLIGDQRAGFFWKE
jgi:hypothetical protein